MRPELIIFDFDGTLADTTATILSTYRMTIWELGIGCRTDDECKATIGLPLKEGFRQLYTQFSDAELDNCVETYRRIFKENKQSFVAELYPGVRDTLDKFARCGIRLSIASSRSHESLVEFCNYTGVTALFDLILGADDVVNAKPDPEPVLSTLSRLQCKPDYAVVVGDMPVDIAMGKGAGCRTVGVTYGNSTRKDLVKAGASLIIDSFPELIDCFID